MAFLKRFKASLESLSRLPDDSSYVVAYSGGLDSHVLLYCCRRLELPVRAVHVHHGLQSIADDWVEHCQAICASLDVHLDVVYVEVQQQRGQSPEEAARIARYQALENNLQENDCLLTAQHINDQAETLLLQLFRTGNTAGLSAMRPYRRLGGYIHLRPLLFFSKNEIERFAREESLHWVEDPSNQDVSFDRNFIRKQLVPVLQKRWPNVVSQLSTVADMQANNLQVQEDMAAIDLANAIRMPGQQIATSVYHVVSILSVETLLTLSSARLLNLLRYWVLQSTAGDSADCRKFGLSPTRKLLEEIERALLHSQRDANPVIFYAGYELRKHRDYLYLLKSSHHDEKPEELPWTPSNPVTIPVLNIQLSAINATGKGLKQDLLNRPLKICFREGGEKFHPAGRQHSQSLKKLFQEAGVPAWQRGGIPLLYSGEELIAVIGFWYSRQHAANDNEEGWLIKVDKVQGSSS